MMAIISISNTHSKRSCWGANQSSWIFSRHICWKKWPFEHIPVAVSNSNADSGTNSEPIPTAITKTMSNIITDFYTEIIGEFDLNHSKRSTLVLATGPGNLPVVRIWTAKMGRFVSRPVQKPDLLHLAGPNPDLGLSTHGFCRVGLDPSVPISCSAFQVSHLWSHSDMLLLIVKYWQWYITAHFRCIGRLNVQDQ